MPEMIDRVQMLTREDLLVFRYADLGMSRDVCGLKVGHSTKRPPAPRLWYVSVSALRSLCGMGGQVQIPPETYRASGITVLI